MKRKPLPEELRLWSRVAATVHPIAGRLLPELDVPAAPSPVGRPLTPADPGKRPARYSPPSEIEPNRKRLIVREHLEARIDLHGLDQDRARAALESFLLRVWNEGYRAALVITGKGTRGDGVLRRYAPEWLAAPHLRDVVAGVSEAHRRHGGEGALYVALKRKPRP
jgi:DNA-nicking Smr family endonuclease